MAKKETLKAVLYVLAGVIIALLIFTFSGMGENRNEVLDNEPKDTTATTTDSSKIWNANSIAKIRAAVGDTFLDIKTEQSEKISIYKKADITGDGIEEALVSLGSGGAYSGYYALMQVDPKDKTNTKIVSARFKTAEGKIEDVMFVEGTSVSHGMSVEMAPSKQAIYAESWQIDPINPDTVSCQIEAYKWNKNSGIFEFNDALGKSATESYCSGIFAR